MNIVWTIIDVEAKTQPNKSGKGDPLEFLNITYKSTNRDGRVQTNSKSLYKVYANPDVYAALAASKKDDEIGLRMEKNDRGFWDVVALVDASVVPTPNAPAAVSTGSPAVGRGTVTNSTYPTAEERANTQRNIVRQSCLAQAVAYTKGDDSSIEWVLDVAEQFVAFINKSE